MNLSLFRIMTQRFEQHEAVGLTLVDPAGEVYRQGVLINRGAGPEEIAAALDQLAECVTGTGEKLVVGENPLVGHEINRAQHPGAEAVDWEAPIPVARHEKIIVNGVKMSGAFLEALTRCEGVGRTLHIHRDGDVVNFEDITGREGNA